MRLKVAMIAQKSLDFLLSRIRARASLSVGVEWALCLVVLASAVGVGAQLYFTGHLTSPLQPDPRDFGMDLFRTAYWGVRGGMYSVWRSVYPPLSFMFVRLFSNPECYRSGAYAAKLCDHGLITAFFVFYALSVILALFVFWRLDRRTAIPRALALAAGLPMLYGLEWTNLVVVCFAFFVVAEGGAAFPLWVRCIAGGVALNLKPYLLFAAYPLVTSRRKWCLVGLTCCSLAIYLASFLVVGSGSPGDIVSGMWFYVLGQPQELVRYNHLTELAQNGGGAWQAIYPFALRAGQVAAVLGCLAAALSPGRIRSKRLGALLLTTISSEVALRTHAYAADYSQIFFIFLIFTGLGGSLSARIALICAYLLCMPLDIGLIRVGKMVAQDVFSGRKILVDYSVMLGQYVRPIVLLVLQGALIRLNLTDMGKVGWADRLRTRFQALRASHERAAPL